MNPDRTKMLLKAIQCGVTEFDYKTSYQAIDQKRYANGFLCVGEEVIFYSELCQHPERFKPAGSNEIEGSLWDTKKMVNDINQLMARNFDKAEQEQ